MSRALRPALLLTTFWLGGSVAVACGSDATNDAPDASGGGAGTPGADSDEDGDADGGGSGGGSGGGPGPQTCANASPALAVTRVEESSIAALGRPFDTAGQDRSGPNSWAARYGKSPEIVPVVHEDGLAVAFQDQEDGAHLWVVHVAPSGSGYAIDAAYEVESLGRLMGFDRDSSGNYYVASGVDEDELVDATHPPNDVHRSDVVRVVKFDAGGCVLMESDVDMARGELDPGSEIIVNPMVAASSRLVWGADRLLLVHGHNTEPDTQLGGTRHQKAIATHLDAATGAATRTSTMWVSHSFDQRALFDGTGFVELHLGDAYPRTIALGRYGDDEGRGGYAALHIKGDIGANETHTRLGSLLRTSDATYGYLALFSTENDDETGAAVNSPRNVGLVRIRSDFTSHDDDDVIVETGGDTSLLVSTQHWEDGGTPVQAARENHLRWLTALPANTHAERPRMAAVSGDQFVVLFERWTTSGPNANGDQYTGTYGVVVDSSGEVVLPAAAISGAPAIGRGDDIVSLDGRALYVTGEAGSLWLNFVDSALSGERFELP